MRITDAESKDGSCPHCGESDLITFENDLGFDRVCNECGGGFDIINEDKGDEQ